MKNYVVVKKNIVYNRRAGSNTFDLFVYKIGRSGVKYIAHKEFNSGSYKGEISAASNMLVEAKEIPASWETDNAYHNYESTKYHIDLL